MARYNSGLPPICDITSLWGNFYDTQTSPKTSPANLYLTLEVPSVGNPRDDKWYRYIIVHPNNLLLVAPSLLQASDTSIFPVWSIHNRAHLISQFGGEINESGTNVVCPSPVPFGTLPATAAVCISLLAAFSYLLISMCTITKRNPLIHRHNTTQSKAMPFSAISLPETDAMVLPQPFYRSSMTLQNRPHGAVLSSGPNSG